MPNISWIIRRLCAMSIPEVFWRLSQKRIQRQEEKEFEHNSIAVTKVVFSKELSSLRLFPERLHIEYSNREYRLNTSIHLLAGASYEEYKTRWDAGFQTENNWPDTFSYKIEYKQRDNIGDARTNWELNRHFQLALLAKDYYASGNRKYLDEFSLIFLDWNKKNPFLHGISWTSVMEIAIRCSNWCYAYCFLVDTEIEEELLQQLKIGIINMTDYVAKHYSRYSSANNHLIVEAYSIGQSGILFANKEWLDLAIDLLSRELPLQNYSDGVNKELSLHYQSFYMEAMGLMMRLMDRNNIDIPKSWNTMLRKMSQYMSDCMGDFGEVIAFGDDDEGKILDLNGGDIDHYKYVLGMMSILLNKQYIDLGVSCSETLHWLFTKEEIDKARRAERYTSSLNCCYVEGGNTILRSYDRKMLIGIDHAALGYGSIAAHGHADALSFQLFYKGDPIFIDPGTYIYHCDINSRNKFRKTMNHNTVTIDDKDQSEMLGAFLWGRKANTKLLEYSSNKVTKLVMSHDGYKPVIHKRTIEFDGFRNIRIIDELSHKSNAFAILITPSMKISKPRPGEIYLHNDNGVKIDINTNGIISISSVQYSTQYGVYGNAKAIRIGFEKECFMDICLSEGNYDNE